MQKGNAITSLLIETKAVACRGNSGRSRTSIASRFFPHRQDNRNVIPAVAGSVIPATPFSSRLHPRNGDAMEFSGPTTRSTCCKFLSRDSPRAWPSAKETKQTCGPFAIDRHSHLPSAFWSAMSRTLQDIKARLGPHLVRHPLVPARHERMRDCSDSRSFICINSVLIKFRPGWAEILQRQHPPATERFFFPSSRSLHKSPNTFGRKNDLQQSVSSAASLYEMNRAGRPNSDRTPFGGASTCYRRK